MLFCGHLEVGSFRIASCRRWDLGVAALNYRMRKFILLCLDERFYLIMIVLG
ncbi:hypothetical protein LINPERHAP1_LOCUS19067, partial [Linum perenne]